MHEKAVFGEITLKELINLPVSSYKAIIQEMPLNIVDRLIKECNSTIEKMNAEVSSHHNYDLVKKYSDLYKALHKSWVIKGGKDE